LVQKLVALKFKQKVLIFRKIYPPKFLGCYRGCLLARASRSVQVDHPPSGISGDINECTTRSRSRNASHFAHSAFVATFEPKDIGHALSNPNWVNAIPRILRETRCGS
jgi:hypothetical protein